MLTKDGYEQLAERARLERSQLKAVRVVVRLPTGVYARLEPYLQFDGFEGDVIRVPCPRMLADGDEITLELPEVLVSIS